MVGSVIVANIGGLPVTGFAEVRSLTTVPNGALKLLMGNPGVTFFGVCRACLFAWRCKSPVQPDGGEERAKRKGVRVRRGLKEA